jgi:hypothetical protein
VAHLDRWHVSNFNGNSEKFDRKDQIENFWKNKGPNWDV